MNKYLTTTIATREIDGIFNSLYQILPNPDPILKKTGYSIEAYTEIKFDPFVSACTFSRNSGTLMRKWHIRPGKASTEAIELINNVFKNIKTRHIIEEILGAWEYGYQVSEVVWARYGNYLLPSSVIGKPQRWFSFGKENELRIKIPQRPFETEMVDDYKFLLTQFESDYDNPYGIGTYSRCFWPVTLKKGGLKFWAKALERFGTPHIIAKTDRNANGQERKELLSVLKLMVSDACAVIPEDAKIELLFSTHTQEFTGAHEKFVRYHDETISLNVLGHTGAAQGTPGRLGNETAALKVREDIINADCKMVESTIDTLIHWIFYLNPSLGTHIPSFELVKNKNFDTKRSVRDVNLLKTGKIKFSKEYFINHYGFDKDNIEIL